MKTHWDTSAVINAAVSAKVKATLGIGEHVTRPHTFAEFFSRMTGRGIRWTDDEGTEHQLVFNADNATLWLRDFAAKVQMVELSGEETLSTLDKARAKGISGPHVHDLLHASAAEKAGADRILTRNSNDFAGLAETVRVAWP